MEIHPLIRERRSIRSFSDEAISDEALLSLIEAARWAPSSVNEQPWRFILVKKNESETFEKLLNCLNESNRVWAKNAAAFVVAIVKTEFSRFDKTNLHAYHDTGLAIGNLTVQATSLGIYLHQMGGFDKEKAETVFEVTDGFEAINIVAMGYKGNADLLPDAVKQKENLPRVRKPLEEILFSGKFGKQSSLLFPVL